MRTHFLLHPFPHSWSQTSSLTPRPCLKPVRSFPSLFRIIAQLLFAVLLLSLPIRAFSFSCMSTQASHEDSVEACVVFTLDHPLQLASIKQAVLKNEVWLMLATPCASTEHVFESSEEDSLLKSLVLERDRVRLRLDAHVSQMRLDRTRPDEVRLTFVRKVQEGRLLASERTRYLDTVHAGFRLFLPRSKALVAPALPVSSAFSAGSQGEPLAGTFDDSLRTLPVPDAGTVLFPILPPAPNTEFRQALRGRATVPYSDLRLLLQEEKHEAGQSKHTSLNRSETDRSETRDVLPVRQQEQRLPGPTSLNRSHSTSLLSRLFSFFVAEARADARSNDRVLSIAPQDIRARVNSGGPESWPEGESLETTSNMPALSPKEQESDGPDASSFISEPVHNGHTGQKEVESSAHGIPPAVTPENRDEPFPQNDIPNPTAPEAEAPPKDDPVFPKQETPFVSGNDEKPFPKEETPFVSGDDEKPFPKNETPQVAGEEPKERPFPKNEVPGAVKPDEDKKQEKKGAGSVHTDLDGSVHGRASKEQEGLVKPKPEEEQKPPAEREVIYVDESGNPVEKPLDIKSMMTEIRELMEQKKYEEAMVLLERVKQAPDTDAATMEEVLYLISDCYWFRYERNLVAGFDTVVSSTSEALHYNLRSQRVPDALLRLALAHLGVGNTLDAEGYIMAIIRRYPSYPGTSVGLTALAKAYLKKGRPDLAEQFFSIVLDKYPESSQLKDASVGLIDAYFQQKKYDRARLILDFVNKRWSRQYIDDPSFLLLQAHLEKEFMQTEKQVQTLWQLYNLQPSGEYTVPIFLEMADLYLAAKNLPIANYLYNEIIKRAPESDEAITARLRLTEQGFYNSPLSMETLSAIFGRGSKPPFWQVYQDVASRSKTNPEAVLANLKLALWYLWDKRYPEAMSKAADFIDDFPEHPDAPLAKEIIWQSFEQELALAFSEQNYHRILTLWNGFPLVRKRYGQPDAKLRYALAQAQKERGDDEGYFELMRTFLSSPMDPTYGEEAFLAFFNRYLALGNWKAILDLGRTVAGWPLKPELQQDLAYAMALSSQNLGLEMQALGMWREIANAKDAQLYQKAWATVFLAQDAERRKDIREAYAANLKVVELFTKLEEERSDKADPERIKLAMLSLMDICEVANHIPEALTWVNRYRPFTAEDAPDYPALRFRESRLYRKLGDSNRSKALLEEIVRHYADSPYAKAAQSELQTFEISRDLQSFQAQPSTPGPLNNQPPAQ